jgi:FkbM family methyltransferase
VPAEGVPAPPLEAVHRLASRLRHTVLFERHPWLASTIEPAWQRMFDRASARRGLVARVNGEDIRLTYRYAARYDRVGVYEPAFHRAFIERIGPGMTILDVGAHIGFLALAAARRVGPGGRVYAFEPAPETASLLQRHIELNGYGDRIEVVRAVVCDRPGTVPFYARGDSMAASISRYNTETLTPEKLSAPTVQLVAAGVTLDQFCAEREIEPDVVKIDVEGAELQVLRGAERLLRGGTCQVLCEVHPAELRGCGASLDELRDFLACLGRRLVPLDEANALGIFHARVEP